MNALAEGQFFTNWQGGQKAIIENIESGGCKTANINKMEYQSARPTCSGVCDLAVVSKSLSPSSLPKLFFIDSFPSLNCRTLDWRCFKILADRDSSLEPFVSGVRTPSGVRALSGVRTLSGVRALSGVRLRSVRTALSGVFDSSTSDLFVYEDIV